MAKAWKELKAVGADDNAMRRAMTAPSAAKRSDIDPADHACDTIRSRSLVQISVTRISTTFRNWRAAY
jgi:hypothetical protein